MIALLTTVNILIGIMGYTPIKIPENHGIYPRTFVVDEIDTKTDTLYLIDGADLEWKYKGIEDYNVGDLISAIMEDNGTPDYIYDDKILNMRYGGIMEGK